MILPIYVYGQPVLRKVAQDITPDYPELKELIANMFETMDNADGIGLAAPQIGRSIRLSVIDLDVLSEYYPEYKGFRKAFINPHILEVDEAMRIAKILLEKEYIDKFDYNHFIDSVEIVTEVHNQFLEHIDENS